MLIVLSMMPVIRRRSVGQRGARAHPDLWLRLDTWIFGSVRIQFGVSLCYLAVGHPSKTTIHSYSLVVHHVTVVKACNFAHPSVPTLNRCPLNRLRNKPCVYILCDQT